MYDQFYSALLDPAEAIPDKLHCAQGLDPGQAFDLHRNNVVTSLIDVMASHFPVVHQLVGEAFFRAMAHEYVTLNLPDSPVLMTYGGRFAQFIAGFAPAQATPYLAQVAQLEFARIRSLHSADTPAIYSRQLVELVSNPDQLNTTGVSLAPSIEVMQFSYAVASLWQAHQPDAEQNLEGLDIHQPEALLLSRPGLKVEMHRIEAGAAEFIERLSQGMSFTAARDISPRFDELATLRLLIEQGAITALISVESNVKR